jgi:hypothetical protein
VTGVLGRSGRSGSTVPALSCASRVMRCCERRVGGEAAGDAGGTGAALRLVGLLEPQVRGGDLEALEGRRVVLEPAERVDHRLRVAQHLRGGRVREVLTLARHGEADELRGERCEDRCQDTDHDQQRPARRCRRGCGCVRGHRRCVIRTSTSARSATSPAVATAMVTARMSSLTMCATSCAITARSS